MLKWYKKVKVTLINVKAFTKNVTKNPNLEKHGCRSLISMERCHVNN